MAKKSDKQITSPEEIHVTLKPVLGIEPGTYLTVLYSAVLLVIVFLLLFLPGIRNYGSEVAFYTVPGDSDVYIDGQYTDGTPVKVFVEAGKHEILLEKRFYESRTFTVNIKGRLFGSLFFPKRTIIARGLVLEDPKAYAAEGYARFSSWSLIHEPHTRYQIPPVLSTTVEDLLNSGREDAFDAGRELVEASLGFSVNETTLRDLIRGAALVENGGKSLLPQAIPGILSDIAGLQSEHPGFALWLDAQLSEEASSVITGTGWFTSVSGVFTGGGEPDSRLSGAEGTAEEIAAEGFISILGLPFRYISGGSRWTYPFEGDTKDKVLYTYRGMYVMTREVTYRDFSRFLEETPRWRPDNREVLIEGNLVTEDYLADWDEFRGTDHPVKFVSHYAAEAFCKWLDSRLPSGFTGMRAALPNEYQWEAAAFASDTTDNVLYERGVEGTLPSRNPSVLGDFYGNLWEWCGNDFKRNDGISFDASGRYEYTSLSGFAAAEKAVRGGSWASIPELVSVSSRGSQPPEWCTPFLGFRVIVQGAE